jgi:hypothetical protein
MSSLAKHFIAPLAAGAFFSEQSEMVKGIVSHNIHGHHLLIQKFM